MITVKRGKGAQEPKTQTARAYPEFPSHEACLGVLLLPPGQLLKASYASNQTDLFWWLSLQCQRKNNYLDLKKGFLVACGMCNFHAHSSLMFFFKQTVSICILLKVKTPQSN